MLDFHGQRTTFVTSLARAGVPPATAQRLARHSDMKLTMGTYTRLEVEDLLSAVEKLPDLRSGPAPEVGPTSDETTVENAEADDPRLGGLREPGQSCRSRFGKQSSPWSPPPTTPINEPTTPPGKSRMYHSMYQLLSFGVIRCRWLAAPPTRHSTAQNETPCRTRGLASCDADCQAEGKGFEPSTPYGAPDFESETKKPQPVIRQGFTTSHSSCMYRGLSVCSG